MLINRKCLYGILLLNCIGLITNPAIARASLFDEIIEDTTILPAPTQQMPLDMQYNLATHQLIQNNKQNMYQTITKAASKATNNQVANNPYFGVYESTGGNNVDEVYRNIQSNGENNIVTGNNMVNARTQTSK